MEIFRSKIFESCTELLFGINSKNGFNREEPFYYNMSLTVGDNEKKVLENREHFCSQLGLKIDQVAFQKQTHSDIVTIVEAPGFVGESDALITNKKMIGLAISTADCTPIFLFDKKEEVIAGIHSGWRGSEKKILKKALMILKDNFRCMPENLICFIGPSISQENYEVGKEVAMLFEECYSAQKENGKYLLDVKRINYNMLLDFGIPENNIEISAICSYGNKNLHSYRRDKENSGRALGIIAMKGIK